ncbi:MAG: RnfABCDGE type electron transport complex subunit D [Candidatus Brocadiia bacterium]|nr:RnfABCDGE type electron transport complex subunit D [Candidatus Brocadiia bacterium]
MRWLLELMERQRRHFEAGGMLRTFKPVFEANENFFFAPSKRTSDAPHVRDALDVKRFMSMVIVALLPSTVAAVYFFGLRVVAMIVVSYAVGGMVEVLFAVVRKEDINEGFLVTGLIFPLVLPPALPLWMVGVGVAFGVVVGKELFGGTGRNVFNPALVGRCFLAIGYPKAMASAWIEPGSGLFGRVAQYVGAGDAVSAATPLVDAKGGVMAGLPELFLGNVTGSAGETCALAVIAGGLFLLATRVANWRTVAAVLGSFLLLGALLHQLWPETFGPPGWHLLAGGLLFGAFFMATDPVTSPVTNGGKWACGVLIGTATVLIRNLTGYVEGMMFAILLGNISAPLLDAAFIHFRLRRYR